MIRVHIRCLVFTLLLMVAESGVAAFFLAEPAAPGNRCAYSDISIFGQLRDGDADKFAAELARLDSSCHRMLPIILASDGGSLEEAIRIGRLIRRGNMMTVVPGNQKCLSACVLLLASGVMRIAGGENVGIHRPYFATFIPGASASEIRKRRDEVKRELTNFLEEIDVSAELIDAMMAVPPEGMRLLNHEELERLRIVGRDATYDEQQTSDAAWTLGMTNSDYRKRSAGASLTCRNSVEPFRVCYYALMLEVSLKDAARRLSSADTRCTDKSNRMKHLECFKSAIRR